MKPAAMMLFAVAFVFAFAADVSSAEGQAVASHDASNRGHVWMGAGAGGQALPDQTNMPVQLEFTLTARSGRHLGIPVTVMTIGGPTSFYAGFDYHAEPVGDAGGFLGGGVVHILNEFRGFTGLYTEAGLDLPISKNAIQSYVRGRLGLGNGGVFLSASAGLQLPF